ncbi:MAG: hypothetical protein LBI42_12105 [Chitinispirillales bacterium]|jgi:hypothetical protein|nr:hypothetical protein [Chitinispirillales bacterium]
MGKFTKRLTAGLAAALMMAGGAFAQESSLLADFENNSNQNLFKDYWYFYDDSEVKSSLTAPHADAGKTGNSKVLSAGERVGSSGRELLFTPDRSITSDGINGNSAKLEFTWGRTFQTGYDNTSIEKARNPNHSNCTNGPLDLTWYPESATGPGGYARGCYEVQQFVGIGTNLAPDGSKEGPKGIENATHITFKAKASVPMAVRFAVEMSHIEMNAHFGRVIQVGTTEQTYTIHLKVDPTSHQAKADYIHGELAPITGATTNAGLAQPAWALGQGALWYQNASSYDLIGTNKNFIKKNIVKLAWQIQTGPNDYTYEPVTDLLAPNPSTKDAESQGGTFYLDDVIIHGFRFVAADMCEECVVTTKPHDADPRVDNLTSDPINWLGHYWYGYDDTKTVVDPGTTQGNSSFSGEGVDCNNQYYSGCGLKVIGSGDNAHIGIEYWMGPQLTIGGEMVQPFVGLGTNLYDDGGLDTPKDPSTLTAADFFNATAGGFHGLYFEYRTDASQITFEVHDVHDVKKNRIESATFYIDVPGATGGSWRAVAVPFAKLRQHLEWETVAANPGPKLDLTQLAKFQFKYQGGESGEMFLRNVYLVGTSVPVRHIGTAAKTTGIRASFNRGTIGVNWTPSSRIASGTVSLVNVRGITVSSTAIKPNSNKITARLGNKGALPAGMYFVRINARDVNGKRIVQQVPVNVVK